MKRLNKIVLTIALAFTAGAVMATGNLKVSISKGEGVETHVRVSNSVESQFEMEIRNGNNDIIYYKQIPQPLKLVLNTFDFLALSNRGTYDYEIVLN
nr:hypothetical protein [uncultured Draconibacterium sp.]